MGCTSSGSNMEIETVFLPSLNPFNSSESFIETILPSISIFHFFRFYSLNSNGAPVYFSEEPEVLVFLENIIVRLFCLQIELHIQREDVTDNDKLVIMITAFLR